MAGLGAANLHRRARVARNAIMARSARFTATALLSATAWLCASASRAALASNVLRLTAGGQGEDNSTLFHLNLRYPHALLKVYEELGFRRCPHPHQELERSRAWLFLTAPVDCKAVARSIISKNSKPPLYPPPQVWSTSKEEGGRSHTHGASPEPRLWHSGVPSQWDELTAKQQELFTLGGAAHVYPWCAGRDLHAPATPALKLASPHGHTQPACTATAPRYLIDLKKPGEGGAAPASPKLFDATLNGAIANAKQRLDGTYGAETVNLYNAL